MSKQTDEEVALRRYLLADLDERAREHIEERLFSDDGLAEELEQAEGSLIDDYTFNALPQRDRELFEQNFILNDERRRNLLFARAMDAYLQTETVSSKETARRRQNGTPWWKKLWLMIQAHRVWATAAAAAVVLLVFVGPAAVRWLRKDQLSSLEAQRERIQRQVAEFNRRPFSAQTLTLPSIELSLQPTLLRGGEMQEVHISKDIRVLNLKLSFTAPPYPTYLVRVKPVEGKDLFSIDDLPPEGNGGASSVFVRIPTELLPTNDYQIDVNGVAPDAGKNNVARFSLRVVNDAPRS